MSKYYITSAIPYVNACPHIGHALEFIQADCIARYKKLEGKDVLYLCGSDENALKNVQSAEKANKNIQEFIDENALLFESLAKKLSVSFDFFQKGSSKAHHIASQKLWKLCEKNGDIYKKKYKGLYCVGCEEFKATADLTKNGECPEHIGKPLEEIEEENYFFALSKYQNQLKELIVSGKFTIAPEFRKNEILNFIESGLQDFSISRSNTRAKDWGVPVPDDATQRIYVWFDALNIYQSGIGFGSNEELYHKWWPADLHVVGKGIIRFHAIYWPAILLSAKLLLPHGLFVHEYFTVNGQKMSKTLGNVIDPVAMVEKYSTDAIRYYCLAKISPFSDGDFSEEKLRNSYNADLANGLGNLVARVAKLAEKNEVSGKELSFSPDREVKKHMDDFRFDYAIEILWNKISLADKLINEKKPWTLSKTEAIPVIEELVKQISSIAYNLQPFLPETAHKILFQFQNKQIVPSEALFPRITV